MTFSEFRRGADFGPGPAPGLLATLCYQSRVAKEPATDDLNQLLVDARERNKGFGVTGMLVHEGDRYFQWLEGPSAALGVLWTSINRDARHREVELLGEGFAPVRLFSEWDLRYLDRGPAEAAAAPVDAAEGSEVEAMAVTLARMALANDEEGMAGLALGRASAALDAGALCRELFEAAAHQLGDWWCDDVCTSIEITLALSKLQSLVRRVDAQRSEPRRIAIDGRSILVSPPPRETHMLGAALLGGFFRRAGWSVQAEFPREDPDLMGLVRSQWLDALALTLSDVFTRQDRLSALIQTIKDVRLAARNPNMAVIVGGRAFTPTSTTAAELVGADVHYESAGQGGGGPGLLALQVAPDGREGAGGCRSRARNAHPARRGPSHPALAEGQRRSQGRPPVIDGERWS